MKKKVTAGEHKLTKPGCRSHRCQITLERGVVRVTWPTFTVRCYASTVYVVALCLSVCPSVRLSHASLYGNGRITETTPHSSPDVLFDHLKP